MAIGSSRTSIGRRAISCGCFAGFSDWIYRECLLGRSRKEPAPMIEVTALTKRYGSLTVLDGVDFAVQAGEIAAVGGPSGAGKSTLARCINLLEDPPTGSPLADGTDLASLSRRELRSARRAI